MIKLKIHVVRAGESVYSIGKQYGVPAQRIISDNELRSPYSLVIGEALVIIEGNRIHVVQQGDSIYSIAKRYGIGVDDIIAINSQVPGLPNLYIGAVLLIPHSTINLGTIEVNGYALPNIRMNVLRKTLPYLTYLSIFSHQARADGSINNIPDGPLIKAARAAGVAPIMVITNIEEGKSFSGDLAHPLLTNQQIQNNFINNIIRILKTKNYAGLDIDFEYLHPYDRESYNNFLRTITSRLRPLGYTITTALAPKLQAEQPGILYEAHDYPVHGALLDHVILMTYEWGYTYSEPKAVAPINEIRKVMNYAVTAIPRNKIFMGIPTYGYDWTLPYKPRTSARAISNKEAIQLALVHGAQIQYDYKAQSPFFTYYTKNGVQHEVWFEDARSILAKLMLTNEFSLGGISYWTIQKYFPQNWLVLSSLYNIRKVL